MVLKDCPDEEDLNILTDSLSAIVLLQSMHRKDLPLWLYRHTARQLLQHTAQVILRYLSLGTHYSFTAGTELMNQCGFTHIGDAQ